jgi:hypothetical protein
MNFWFENQPSGNPAARQLSRLARLRNGQWYVFWVRIQKPLFAVHMYSACIQLGCICLSEQQ